MWVIIIAEVLLFIFLKIFSGLAFQVLISQSTKMGLRPSLITHNAVEIIEKAGMITSEFF